MTQLPATSEDLNREMADYREWLAAIDPRAPTRIAERGEDAWCFVCPVASTHLAVAQVAVATWVAVGHVCPIELIPQ